MSVRSQDKEGIKSEHTLNQRQLALIDACLVSENAAKAAIEAR